MPKRQLKKKSDYGIGQDRIYNNAGQAVCTPLRWTFLQAYHYVSQYGGIEYAERHYNVLHTLTFDDQVEGFATYCHRKGGELL